MFKKLVNFQEEPILFGTDGWRGVLGVDFTLDRLRAVAAAATQELIYQAPQGSSKKIIIGYDRRFLAFEFAEAITSVVRGFGIHPLIAEEPVTTPACSWAVVQQKALGALVITASHNPPEWLGLKIKGPFGSSVDGDFTKAVEKRLAMGSRFESIHGKTEIFDCRSQHLLGLRKKFDIPALIKGLDSIGLKVIVDSMHGSAAGCIGKLLGELAKNRFEEIRTNRDPFFGGNSPEPLSKYLNQLISAVKASHIAGQPAIGLAFDGDGDRIVAIDEKGRFCSNQLLMPLFIEHLADVKKLPGSIVKTVSGSDLMKLVSESLGRKVLELPVGFKFIAAEMFATDVLVGGEESGGIGFGNHMPERDALYAALLLLECIAQGGVSLGQRIDSLQDRFGKMHYERIDINLENNNSKLKIEEFFKNKTPKIICNNEVKEIILIDGIKIRFGEGNWLMLRFSGTEPLLRIYCEGTTEKQVKIHLEWAKKLAESI